MRGRTLVTGACGHLGANLVRRLLSDGEAVRVLLRPDSKTDAVEGLDVERVTGDLRDRESLERAVQGCERVYHAAAIVSIVAGNAAHRRAIFETNVLGTRRLLEAALRNGVRRVVVTGSFSAVGYDPEDPSKPSDEEMAFDPFRTPTPYSTSKAACEHQCWEMAARGLEVVVAVSCAIIGPNDFKPSRLGGVLCSFARGELACYIPGGFPWVAARDIAEGHILTMNKGRSGQRYIFATEYKTMDELMAIFEEVTGRKRPSIRLSPKLMYGIAKTISPFVAWWVPPERHRLTPAAIDILTLHRRADITKAETELGYRPTSVIQAAREACEWFRGRGFIPPKVGPVPQESGVAPDSLKTK
jgi:nucleoside-diphosphate-sugar epimerase